jgi:hypothetical protein
MDARLEDYMVVKYHLDQIPWNSGHDLLADIDQSLIEALKIGIFHWSLKIQLPMKIQVDHGENLCWERFADKTVEYWCIKQLTGTKLRMGYWKMDIAPNKVTLFLLFLFLSSASAQVIFSRRAYTEHGMSYQEIWTWNPANGDLKALTNSARDHYNPTCDGRTRRLFSGYPDRTRNWSNARVGDQPNIAKASARFSVFSRISMPFRRRFILFHATTDVRPQWMTMVRSHSRPFCSLDPISYARL